jgi:hypothetical protein
MTPYETARSCADLSELLDHVRLALEFDEPGFASELIEAWASLQIPNPQPDHDPADPT